MSQLGHVFVLHCRFRDKNLFQRLRSGERHLLNLQLYLNALEYREALLLSLTATRLRSRKGVPFMKWNQSLDLVVQLGLAHTERLVFQSFASKATQPDAPRILRVLAALYGVSIVLDDMALLSAHNYFSARKIRALYDERLRLCGVLRPHALQLVEAFGIDESLMDAPIAGDWLAAHARGRIPGEDAATAKL